MSGRWHPAATSSSTISINRRAVLSSCSDLHAQEHDLPSRSLLNVIRLNRPVIAVGPSARPERSVIVRLADVVLCIQLKSKLADEVELRLQQVDMFLFIVHQLLE